MQSQRTLDGSSKSHSFEGVNWIFVENFKMHKNNSRRAQKTLKKITCQFESPQYPLAIFHHITQINLSLGFLFFRVLSSPFLCPFNESKQSSPWFCKHKVAKQCCLTVTLLQCVYGGFSRWNSTSDRITRHAIWVGKGKNFQPSTETVLEIFYLPPPSSHTYIRWISVPRASQTW